MSKTLGILLRTSEATSSRISSSDLPPPEVARAWEEGGREKGKREEGAGK